MEFDSDFLEHRLTELAAVATPSRWIVAFSGGLDSTVLLHAAAGIRGRPPLLAMHICHNLHNDATEWTSACRETAAAFGVDFLSIDVEVPRDSGLGIEAAARNQRYAALQSAMRTGDWLLSAHHQYDQAETLLLNLMRGSGVHGLAAIGAVRPLGPGHLVRPLLDVPRKSLRDYATAHELAWLEDPGNADAGLDRNYLRLNVLPPLRERWPAALSKIARSAGLAREAVELLDDLAEQDLQDLGTPDRIELAGLTALSHARQKNVVRYAVRQCALPPVSDTALRRILGELVPARDDAEPCVSWAGAEARRYRGRLYLLQRSRDGEQPPSATLSDAQPALRLEGLGTLRISEDATTAIRDDVLRAGLEVHFRRGGESIRLPGRGTTQSLKKLLQERGVVPWMRKKIPLLYSGTTLVAVADLWVAEGYQCETGRGLCWLDTPPLY